MIKYLFSVINPSLLFILSLFYGNGDVSVSSTVPEQIQAGQQAPLEIRIHKENITGFGIFELKLPEGITVIEDEENVAGATYSFNKTVAKWEWEELPDAEEIVLMLKITAAENAAGVNVISGKFVYSENNEKQEVEMPSATFTVRSQSAETVMEDEPRAEPAQKITAERSMTKVGNNEYLVNIKINKGITRGFAKYSDDIQDNFVYKVEKSDSSSFSIADGKIKFVWVSVPQREQLQISYRVSRNQFTTMDLKGEYYYLENNQSKIYKLPADVIYNSESATVSNEETSPKSEETSSQPAVVSQPKQDTGKKQETSPKSEVVAKQTEEQKQQETANVEKEIKKKQPEIIIKKEPSVDYKVQIGAFAKAKVNAKRLEKKFKITEKISSEMQDGFSKFMVGYHSQYKEARNHREQMKEINGIKTAFVVAYNGTKRITVQEALMITNQKWFK